MDVWVVSANEKLALQVDSRILVDQERRAFVPMNPEEDHVNDGVIVFRHALRGVAVLASGTTVSLTVNGNRVTGGLYQIDSNSLVRLRWGQTEHSLAVIFDDSVVDVPAGSTCDICGKGLRETGKGHCRKKLCIECVEAFGTRCPDCGRELLDTNTSEQAASLLQEYFME